MIEQTKTIPQEVVELEMNKQMQPFSFNPPINLSEEGEWLLGVTFFECKNSVFNITDENNSFSITVPSQWENKCAENNIDELNNLLELRFLELHVKEVRRRSSKIRLGDNEYILSDFDNSKTEILEELKNVKYSDLDDMVYRMQLTYDEIIDVLELKYIPTKKTSSFLKPNIYQISDINKSIKNISPDNVKISVTIDEKIIKSSLKINQTLITDKSFFYAILGFTQRCSYNLVDIDGLRVYQLIAGSYESEKSNIITGKYKVHLNCDCIQGYVINGAREHIFYRFVLNKPTFHKIFKEPRVKLFRRVNESVLSHVTIYSEYDDHKPVAFNGETISFTCQLIKIQFSYL